MSDEKPYDLIREAQNCGAGLDPALQELLTVILNRLDRLETRAFQQEAPTVPNRRPVAPLSSEQLDAIQAAIQSETRILEKEDLVLDPKEFPKTAKPMVPK